MVEMNDGIAEPELEFRPGDVRRSRGAISGRSSPTPQYVRGVGRRAPGSIPGRSSPTAQYVLGGDDADFCLAVAQAPVDLGAQREDRAWRCVQDLRPSVPPLPPHLVCPLH